MIGYGTKIYQSTGETETQVAEKTSVALNLGYRFIDLPESAEEITTAISQSKTSRKNLFISQKIYTEVSIDGMKERNKNIEYLDLLYIANPPITSARITFNAVMRSLWLAMIEVKNLGLVRFIGICNFHSKQLRIFLKLCQDNNWQLPDYAFLEVHPFNYDSDLIKLYQKNKIGLISYSPLGMGIDLYPEHLTIQKITKKYGAESYAQILLSWLLSKDISSAVKSTNIEHMTQNLKLIDLAEEDIEILDNLNSYAIINNDTANSYIANGEITI